MWIVENFPGTRFIVDYVVFEGLLHCWGHISVIVTGNKAATTEAKQIKEDPNLSLCCCQPLPDCSSIKPVSTLQESEEKYALVGEQTVGGSMAFGAVRFTVVARARYFQNHHYHGPLPHEKEASVKFDKIS